MYSTAVQQSKPSGKAIFVSSPSGGTTETPNVSVSVL